MRTKDFIHDFIVKKAGTSAIARIKFSPHSDANHMKTIHWDYYQRLADLTNLLTFGCNFTDLGCASRRWPSLERLQQMEIRKCCPVFGQSAERKHTNLDHRLRLKNQHKEKPDLLMQLSQAWSGEMRPDQVRQVRRQCWWLPVNPASRRVHRRL